MRRKLGRDVAELMLHAAAIGAVCGIHDPTHQPTGTLELGNPAQEFGRVRVWRCLVAPGKAARRMK